MQVYKSIMAINSVLLFGGTFDPIHHGHHEIATFVATKLSVDKVIFVPAADPPHKDTASITSAKDRYAMVELAIQDEPLFSISDCELKRQGPSYTIDTIRYFQDLFGSSTQLFWLIGADSIKDLGGWYKIEELVESCQIVTACRPGANKQELQLLCNSLSTGMIKQLETYWIETPEIDISSTSIRECAIDNKPIDSWVSLPVVEYIHKHQLYKKNHGNN